MDFVGGVIAVGLIGGWLVLLFFSFLLLLVVFLRHLLSFCVFMHLSL